MRVPVVLLLCLAAVSAASSSPERIVGGSLTYINSYPYVAALLHSYTTVFYVQTCAGSIINTRSILSSARCFNNTGYSLPSQWRARAGSTFANSGGYVYTTSQLILHPQFNRYTLDNDVAIIRTGSTIGYVNNLVQPASIAGANYFLADNSAVYAVGWGRTAYNGPYSEQLRHVQIWTVNQTVCVQRYNELRRNVTANMLCAGWLDVGGREQCIGDGGGPLIHNRVVVGVTSWAEQCGLARYPGVNTRVSSFSQWITTNA